jgi:hypothetical protein
VIRWKCVLSMEHASSDLASLICPITTSNT